MISLINNYDAESITCSEYKSACEIYHKILSEGIKCSNYELAYQGCAVTNKMCKKCLELQTARKQCLESNIGCKITQDFLNVIKYDLELIKNETAYIQSDRFPDDKRTCTVNKMANYFIQNVIVEPVNKCLSENEDLKTNSTV